MGQIRAEVEGFKIGSFIGNGGFATVYRAHNPETGEVAACKFTRYNGKTTEKDKLRVAREAKLQQHLSHPNIVRLIAFREILPDSDDAKKYIEGGYFLMEYLEAGELFDKIVTGVGLPHDLARIYFNQLISGVEYIHNMGICHRDLKAENVLLAHNGRVKISDFGMASLFQFEGHERKVSWRAGTPAYMAPEVLMKRTEYFPKPVDYWALGILLYTLLTGRSPWDMATGECREYIRFRFGSIWQDSGWISLDSSVRGLITGLLHDNPELRFSVEDVRANEWFVRKGSIQEDPISLARALSAPLRESGDMSIVDPLHDLQWIYEFTAGNLLDGRPVLSQFSQALMLFSQTEDGGRVTHQLTRFYANLNPDELYPNVLSAVLELKFKAKVTPRRFGSNGHRATTKTIKVGGYIERETLKGYIQLEHYPHEKGMDWTFVVMHRKEGNPLMWRRFWREIVNSDEIWPFVIKRSPDSSE